MQKLITLRQRGYKSFQGWALWLNIIMAAAFMGAIIWLYPASPEIPFSKTSVYLILIALYISYVFFYAKYNNQAQIEMDEFGIIFKSGLPSFLQRFRPDWRISWGEIQHIKPSITKAYSPSLSPLKIQTLNKNFTVYPLLWIDSQGNQKNKLFVVNNNHVEMYDNSPLVKIFRKKGYLEDSTTINRRIQSKWAERAGWSNLNTSPTALIMIAFFTAGIFYYFADSFFLQTEKYTTHAPYLYIAIATALAFIISFVALLMTKLMAVEKIMLAIFVSISTALITSPFLIRVNQWTDTEGLQTHNYTALTHLTWVPTNKTKNLPDIKFASGDWEFWHSYEIGSDQVFRLRKGKLGFYQIDMKDIYKKQKAFYHSKY